jgi:hypothetical protein
MPDHLHALVVGRGDDGHAADVVRAAKQRTSFYFKQSCGSRLWQRSYFDRTLRTRDDVRDEIAYVVSNPIRAGLVASANDYPHWGSQRYSRKEIVESFRSGRPEGRPLQSLIPVLDAGTEPPTFRSPEVDGSTIYGSSGAK